MTQRGTTKYISPHDIRMAATFGCFPPFSDAVPIDGSHGSGASWSSGGSRLEWIFFLLFKLSLHKSDKYVSFIFILVLTLSITYHLQAPNTLRSCPTHT